MLTRRIVLLIHACLLAALYVLPATAQFIPTNQSGANARPHPNGPMPPTVLPYPGRPAYPERPSIPVSPSIPAGPQVPGGPGGNPDTGIAVDHLEEGSASVQPLGCRIADRIESCLTKFGAQQTISCPGCDPDNITCPAGKQYAIPATSISSTSWDKNRAASVKPSKTGYSLSQSAAVICGTMGQCDIKCETREAAGITYHWCPKVNDTESAIRIDYFNLSVTCPVPPLNVPPPNINADQPMVF